MTWKWPHNCIVCLGVPLIAEWKAFYAFTTWGFSSSFLQCFCLIHSEVQPAWMREMKMWRIVVVSCAEMPCLQFHCSYSDFEKEFAFIFAFYSLLPTVRLCLYRVRGNLRSATTGDAVRVHEIEYTIGWMYICPAFENKISFQLWWIQLSTVLFVANKQIYIFVTFIFHIAERRELKPQDWFIVLVFDIANEDICILFHI